MEWGCTDVGGGGRGSESSGCWAAGRPVAPNSPSLGVVVAGDGPSGGRGCLALRDPPAPPLPSRHREPGRGGPAGLPGRCRGGPGLPGAAGPPRVRPLPAVLGDAAEMIARVVRRAGELPGAWVAAWPSLEARGAVALHASPLHPGLRAGP
eukprot:3167565-Alexandrium_andersonii.AAC.1